MNRSTRTCLQNSKNTPTLKKTYVKLKVKKYTFGSEETEHSKFVLEQLLRRGSWFNTALKLELWDRIVI